ncbi:MAG: response regulator [Anaerolineales bacterium]
MDGRSGNLNAMYKILVIEDEQSLREDIIEILRYEDFDVLGSENGIKGLEAIRTQLPDLIICDIMMPELDGYGVLIELRSNPTTVNIPVIFLTAKTNRADMRRGMELGADDYLTKPFTQPELIAAINTRLEKHKSLAKEYERRFDELRQNVIRALPHELRTPLTGILGYSRILMEDADILDGKQVYQMAYGISKAAHRLLHLTENYLLYARTEIIQSDPERLRAIRENAAVEAAKVYITNAITQKAKDYDRRDDVQCAVDDADLRITSESLDKVTQEIIDNALKFSETGTPIYVEGHQVQGRYRLRISNTGPGLDPEHISQIGAYIQFERRIYEQSGIGLGLIIAKRLAEIHGGGLDIHSEPNQQTHIDLWFLLA